MTTIPCEPPRTQSIGLGRERDEPRHDPGRGGEAGARQPREREPDEAACQAAARRRRRRREDGRHAVREQVSADDHAPIATKAALRERRQAGDADDEREPDRGAREVEPGCEIGRARIADDERRERRQRERSDEQRRARVRHDARSSRAASPSAAAAHSTASAGPRVRQASSSRPSASGIDIAVRGRARAAECADVIVACTRPSASPRHERAPGVEPDDRGGEQPVEPVARSRVEIECGRGCGEDRREARPDAGERERDADEPLDRQADEHSCVEVLGDRLERAAEARALQQRPPAAASTSAAAATKIERTWIVAPPTCQKPPSPMRRNGNGSGNTYAGRSKKTTSSVRTANATASDAPTQPIIEPRARYGSIARKYEPALAAAVTTSPTASASTKRSAADARLRDRPGAGSDEQRHEDAERDQLAEREMDDAGEPEDERVPDRDEAVDRARREPARENLEDDRHGGL